MRVDPDILGRRGPCRDTSALPGDANGDGSVNAADLDIVLKNYNHTGMGWGQGDFDSNGTVNGGDLNVWLSHKDNGSSVSGAVPEPVTLVLLVTGLLGLLAYGWRKRR